LKRGQTTADAADSAGKGVVSKPFRAQNHARQAVIMSSYIRLPFLGEDLFDFFLVLGDKLKLFIENLQNRAQHRFNINIAGARETYINSTVACTNLGLSWRPCSYTYQ
jgi:hypothetical protein